MTAWCFPALLFAQKQRLHGPVLGLWEPVALEFESSFSFILTNFRAFSVNSNLLFTLSRLTLYK